MEEKNHTKRRFGVFIVLIIAFIIIIVMALSDKAVMPIDSVSEGTTPIKQCYVWNTEAGDRATLLLTTVDTNVEGSFSYIPAEKDSKRGVFTGTLSALPGNSGTRTVHGWWNVLAEGMNSKEEIVISLSGSTAAVGFGEMKDNGDGSYVYADVTKLSYQPVLQEVQCDDAVIAD
jgi:hypothetical protein